MAPKALTSSALDAFYTAEKEKQKGQPVPPPQKFTKRSHMTFFEILDLPIALLSVPIVGFLALLAGPFRARKQRLNPEQGVARTLLLHVGYSILRRVVSRFSPMQIQYAYLFFLFFSSSVINIVSNDRNLLEIQDDLAFYAYRV
jgi:hypothetical protein